MTTTTYHKQYPAAGSFVRVIAETGDGSREIALCSGSVIGSVSSFTQATEDADLIIAALNAYAPEPKHVPTVLGRNAPTTPQAE